MAARFGRMRPLACAALVAVAAAGAPDVARAQGLFDILRGIFGGRPPMRQIEPPLLLEGFPGDIEIPAESGGPYVAYCVRLCDGRYFPLPRKAGAPSMSPAKVCSAMCPAADTQVFSGTSIDRAVADGKNYTSLKNAFLYRSKLVDNCSCAGKRSSGVASIDPMSDPTLRRGDIVVMPDGPKVFTGDGRLPHKASDFKPAENYKGLPRSIRQQLSEMRVREEIVVRSSSPERRDPAVAPTIVPPDAAGPHAGIHYKPRSTGPVADAFSTFTR